MSDVLVLVSVIAMVAIFMAFTWWIANGAL